ncbi:hypothetical protein H8959_003450 [Pygathrix nigripes]
MGTVPLISPEVPLKGTGPHAVTVEAWTVVVDEEAWFAVCVVLWSTRRGPRSGHPCARPPARVARVPSTQAQPVLEEGRKQEDYTKPPVSAVEKTEQGEGSAVWRKPPALPTFPSPWRFEDTDSGEKAHPGHITEQPSPVLLKQAVLSTAAVYSRRGEATWLPASISDFVLLWVMDMDREPPQCGRCP